MEHFRPKRPADSTGAGQVWTHQGLALNGGDQPTGVLVAGRNAAPAARIPFRQSAVQRHVLRVAQPPSNAVLGAWMRAQRTTETLKTMKPARRHVATPCCDF